MPRIRTGEHTTEQVDIVFNVLGVFNRLNIFQLFEQTITFITDQVVAYFKTLDITNNDHLKEMEKILFDIVGTFNEEQRERMYVGFKETCKTKKAKQEFFKNVMDEGIYIHIKAFWHKENLYDAAKACYDKYPWIKPYEVYFFDTISKRWVKQINEQIVGSMYIMVLKQNSKKGLSVCATAPINKRGVPDKTDSAKKHKSIVQHTPIRAGIQESINNMISLSNYDLAKLHMLYRSSPIARRELGTTIIENYGKGEPVEVEITDKMTNRNVEILDAYLNVMGFGLEYENDELYMPNGDVNDEQLHVHKFKGETYIVTPLEMRRIVARDLAKRSLEMDEIITIGDESMFTEEFIDELTDRIEAEIEDYGPAEYIPHKYNEDF